MPELAEVETLVNGLKSKILGYRIFDIYHEDNPRFQPIESMGQVINNVSRKGKFLVFSLDNKEMLISLGMTGKLLLGEDNDSNHRRSLFTLINGHQRIYLNYIDARGFGSIKVVEPGNYSGIMAKLGPDPLEDDFNLTVINQYNLIRKSNKFIKAILLDQRIAAGIGNYLADEILFDAKINPYKYGKELIFKQVSDLNESIKKICLKAVEGGGNSFSDYVHEDGGKGNYQNFMKVYGRANQDCFECGQKIRKGVCAARGTHWCPNCQI